jgi:catalase-peroxidase
LAWPLVPFTAGRTDASQEQTDVESFAVLEPDADGFRNFLGNGHTVPAEHLLIERAFRLTLGAPEMTVLMGGLRALNLLDMNTEWEPTSGAGETFTGRDRTKGEAKWTASRVDLIFGSNSELRALAEVYACDDAQEKFVRDWWPRGTR